MIAAIYSRKSTEQNVADDAKSVTRQIELGKVFAGEKGWTVGKEYVDDGISGVASAKLVSRARMLADAATGAFQVLIVRDLDRLSRDDEELPGLIFALRNFGVEVWCYSDRARVETKKALQRGMLYMRSTFSGAEREAAQDRTKEQKFDRAKQHKIADGRVLGYRNEGPAKERRRVVDPEQAKIVVHIFELAASGKGLLKIVKALSAEGVKNPNGQNRKTASKRSDHWSVTGVRDLLHRRLYLGEVTYGQHANQYVMTPEGRKRIKVAPTEAPVTYTDESLRIVSDDLWTRTHARMKATHDVYLRRNGGRLSGKPESGLESKYLLSGFLKCGVCGGNMVVVKRTGQRGAPSLMYVCATHRTRPADCSMKRGLLVSTIDKAVVDSLRRVLTPDLLEQVIRGYVAACQDTDRLTVQQQALQAELSTLDAELANLAGSLARFGADTPQTVIDQIKVREEAKRTLGAQKEHLDGLMKSILTVDQAATVGRLQALCKDWTTMLRSAPEGGRQVLRLLLDGPAPVVVAVDASGAWKVEIKGAFNHTLVWLGIQVPESEIEAAETVHEVATLAPDGEIIHMWCPRGDSNTRHAV